MTTHSSNLATNLVIEAVGLERVFAVARECGPGLDLRRLIDDRPANRAGIRNEVTARGMARFWADLVAGTLLGPGGTDAALDLLGRNLWNDEIPAGLPPGTRVAHKNGWDDGIRHDTGLVLAADAPPYVLVVLTTGLVDPVAQPLIAAWSAWSWQHRSELDGPLTPPAELAARGVSGD